MHSRYLLKYLFKVYLSRIEQDHKYTAEVLKVICQLIRIYLEDQLESLQTDKLQSLGKTLSNFVQSAGGKA